MNEPVSDSATHNYKVSHDRTLRFVTREVLDELKEFVGTRVQMAKAEFQETMRSLRVAIPLGIIVLALMGTGFLMLTFAAVAIVTVAFAGSPYAWFFGFLIVGVLWMMLGGIAAFFAYNQIKGQGRFPKRTLQVLKADKVWLQSEARIH